MPPINLTQITNNINNKNKTTENSPINNKMNKLKQNLTSCPSPTSIESAAGSTLPVAL